MGNIQKELAVELETALKIQQGAKSEYAKSLYAEKQQKINQLIVAIIEAGKQWDEQKLRYHIAQLDITLEEIKTMENNTRVYDILQKQISEGKLDAQDDPDDE